MSERLFHAIEGGQVVVRKKPGTYLQADLYRRKRQLYAKVGSGFVRLYADGGTSMPGISYDPEDINLEDTDFTVMKEGLHWAVIPPTAVAAE
ncbi:MAG: hypothetical protein AAGG47_21370 [Pseudomonadota bacterium]